ncbi:MAG: hypothetical protein NVS2B16_24070 [Chloroflexota bacterium]
MRGALVGSSLTLVLVAGTVPASAHKVNAIKGIVLQVGGGTLQVQTPSGAVSTGITNGTHVIRVVNGSMADLTIGTNVDLRVVPGTSLVTSVHILPDRAVTKPIAHREPATRTAKGMKPPEARSTSTAHVIKAHKSAPIAPLHDGKVVLINGKIITLRSTIGHTMSFTLSSSATVTKFVLGSVNDLAVGEAVTVLVDEDEAAATEILILNA